jgi:hypothetical protein
MSSIPEPQSVAEYVTDGAHIAAIILIWGAIAAFFRYGMTEITRSFERIFVQFGELLVIVGFLNALLYVFYRTVDYWQKAA